MGTKIQRAYGVGGPLLPVFPVPVISHRAPTAADVDYPLGQVWVNESTSPATLYQFGGSSSWGVSGTAGVATLTGTATLGVSAPTGAVSLSLLGPYAPLTYTAHGVLLGQGGGAITPISPGTTGQVLTAQTGADPVWASPAELSWVATTTGQILVANQGWIDTSALASTLTFPLPAMAAVGDVFGIMCAGNSLNARWAVTCGGGQTISCVNDDSTTSATSNEQYTSATIVCVVANLVFVINQINGTVTLA